MIDFAQGESVVSCCICSLDHCEGSSLFQKSVDFAANKRPGPSTSEDARSLRPARLESGISC